MPWLPLLAAASWSSAPSGRPTTQPCDSSLVGCWDASTQGWLHPALGYAVPCMAAAAVLAIAARRLRWWAALVLFSVAASVAVYLVVLL